MSIGTIRVVALLTALLVTPAPADASVVEHDFTIEIKSGQGEVHVKDRIRLPPEAGALVLSREASAVQWRPGDALRQHMERGHRRLIPASRGTRTIELRYTLPLALQDGTGNAAEGIVWNGSGPWYADVPGRLHTFTLTVTVPDEWRVVSQGGRLDSEEIEGARRREVWREKHPQRSVYLVAAPFTEYAGEREKPRLMAFLRRPDPELAKKYIDLAGRNIDTYETLIGPYPYAKFALVENTWESGYGMPSFTLLGPRVIRLPFIPYTSYPHEILHNWWGNAVYVDYETGNWSEGLTSYLADHRFRAQQGEGAEYRRDALQKYLDFVSGAQDFPLSAFRARHDEASQAVGYGKAMMMFHMLRGRLGDDAFFAALRRFYLDHRFTVAAYADLRRAFERAGGQDLRGFFDQWVHRTGAPALALEDVRLVSADGVERVRGRLRQTQPGGIYNLQVPVRVRGETEERRHRLQLDSRALQFELDAPANPVTVSIDPDFDLFRRLDPGEVPPSLGAAFGSARLTFVVPADTTESERAAFEAFIGAWRAPGRRIAIVTDDSPLPDTGAVWLLGWGNSSRHLLARALSSREVSFGRNAVTLAGKRLPRADSTIILAGRTGDGEPLLWTHLAAGDTARTARRLRHYSGVSYAAFRSGQPVLRGQWPIRDSPLTARLR